MSEWTEFEFRPHATRYRWKCMGFDSHGRPHGLEIERWTRAIEEWTPIANTNVKDAFAMGLMQARSLDQQTKLFREAEPTRRTRERGE